MNKYYVLGLLLSKGKIIFDQTKLITLIFELRFNKPTTSSLRSDNKYNKQKPNNDELYDYLLPDLVNILNLLESIFPSNQVILEHIPEPVDDKDFSRKIARFNVRGIPLEHEFIKYFWQSIDPDSFSLDDIPIQLSKLSKKIKMGAINPTEKQNLKEFLHGISDSAAVIPGPESSAFSGRSGVPRIQIEVDNSRWKLNIFMLYFFQEVFKIRVMSINWPHPTIKCRKKPTVCLKHNHQFRINLFDFKENLDFKFSSIKRSNLQQMYDNLDNHSNRNDFHPRNRKKKKYIDSKTYAKFFNQGKSMQPYTTNPFPCTLHQEDSKFLPKELRGKHYAEWRDINYDLEDFYLKNYASDDSKGDI